jgi:LacI family transcriptional regulator
VTLETIAAEAGVSLATASNALSGNRGVSSAARERVFSAAQRQGYARSPSRRSHKQTKVAVGIVLPDVRNPAYAELAHAFEREGERHGWSIVLNSTDYEPSRELAVLSELVMKTDGVILSPSRPPLSGVHALEGSPVPIVICDEPAESPWIGGAVRSDNFGGGRAAAHHLVDAGGTKFGMIGGRGYLPTTQERREGFLAGLRDHGVADDAVRIVGDHYGMDGGQAAMYELLHGAPETDAVFAVSDLHAVGALFEAQQSGRRVPDDLLLCGFDGIGWTRQMTPTISTVRQDWAGIAEQACSMLEEMMAGAQGRTVILPVEFVAGESTTRGAGALRPTPPR